MGTVRDMYDTIQDNRQRIARSHYSNVVMREDSATIRRAPSTAQSLPFTVYCSPFTVHCLLFTVYCSLSTVHRLLFTVYCSPFTVHCLLFTVYCSPSTVYCLPFTTNTHIYSTSTICHTCTASIPIRISTTGSWTANGRGSCTLPWGWLPTGEPSDFLTSAT